jgi:hypothetical protein
VRCCYTCRVRVIVRLDCSAETAVAVCALCPWREGPTSAHTARVLGTAHRIAAHPGQAQSWATRQQLAAR